LTRWLPAYVGVGSNLDQPARQVRLAIQTLRAASWAHSLQASNLYGSAPLGDRAQPDYCNAVVAFLTPLTAVELLAQLHAIEAALGREPARERWASRRIDLDLLCLAEEQRSTPELTLPHAGIVQRNFVLYPLLELAPELWLPGMGRVATLARAVAKDGIWVLGAAA
jgi:2-amino-4-hydroxy-6-hydroxymethyldihydropteridine diphosphokinase